MKNKLKAFLGVALSLFFGIHLIFNYTTASKAESIDYAECVSIEDTLNLSVEELAKAEKEAVAIEEYKSILSLFADSSEKGDKIYDDNYGGAYLSDDQVLTVLLVDNSEENVKKIIEATGNSNIHIRKCTYSFNDLIGTIEKINASLEHLNKNGIIISEMYEDVQNNCVRIGVKDLNQKKEKIIREIVDCSFMKFSSCEQPVAHVSVKGGDGVVNTDNNLFSTVSFCAIKNGNIEGYVVAGHAVTSMLQYFSLSGYIIGYSSANAYHNNTKADAAFVTKAINGSTTDSIVAYRCHSTGNSISDYLVGSTIYAYGASSGSQVSGHILNNYCTVNYSGTVNITNLTSGSYNTLMGGDSGGPVYQITSVYNEYVTCKLLGNHSGGNNDGTGYFSKYYNIANELNISAITY